MMQLVIPLEHNLEFTEMRETENRSSIEKNQQNQKLVLENISKTDKLLIRLTKKKKR